MELVLSSVKWSYTSPFIELFLDRIREKKACYRLHLKSLLQGDTVFISVVAHLYPSSSQQWALHAIYIGRICQKKKKIVKHPNPLHTVNKKSLRLTLPIKFWLNGSYNNIETVILQWMTTMYPALHLMLFNI